MRIENIIWQILNLEVEILRNFNYSHSIRNSGKGLRSLRWPSPQSLPSLFWKIAAYRIDFYSRRVK